MELSYNKNESILKGFTDDLHLEASIEIFKEEKAELEKGGKALPVGTIRSWNGVSYIKTPKGWIPKGEDNKKKAAKQKEEAENDIKDLESGSIIADSVLGMDIQKYSDKAVLITGDTYSNVDSLREVKKETGVGNWNKKLKGWVFPITQVGNLLGALLGKEQASLGNDDPIKETQQQNQKEVKNAYSVGQSVTLDNGKPAVISKVGHNGTSVEYTVRQGGKELVVTESSFVAKPEKSDEKISQSLNTVTASTRTRATKEIFGDVSVAIKSKELDGVSDKSKVEALQSKRDKMVERLKNLADGRVSKKEKKEATSSKDSGKKKQANTSSGKERASLDKDLVSNQMMSVTEYYQALYGELPQDPEARSKAMMGNQNAAGKRGGKEDEPKPSTPQKEEPKKEEDKPDEVVSAVDRMAKETSDKFIEDAGDDPDKLRATLGLIESQLKGKKGSSKALLQKISENVALHLSTLPTKKEEPKTKITPEPVDPPEKGEPIAGLDISYTVREIEMEIGGQKVKVEDHTDLPPKEIKTYNIKNILDSPKPDYVFSVSGDKGKFTRLRGYLSAVTDPSNPNNVIVDNRFVDWRGGSRNETGGYMRMSREHYMATMKYHQTKMKAEAKIEAQEQADRIIARYKSDYPGREIPKKYFNPKAKRYTFNGNKGVYQPDLDLLGKVYKEFDSSQSPVSRRDKILKVMEMKGLNDISFNNLSIALEDYSSTYHKGKETSYGDKGSRDDLKSEFGIKIKNQNGSEMSKDDIKFVKDKMAEVYDVFGDRSSMSESWNLKVSHAGGVHQHASTAVGLFTPSFNAIGVSRTYGDNKGGFTLGHEFAHFMDYYGAEKSGNSRKFLSHDSSHVAGEIANVFRDNLNDPKAKVHDYLGSSHECFARAFEQYQAMKTYGDSVEKLPAMGDTASISYSDHPAQVSAKKFNEKVAPLIEKFLKDNDKLLKSFQPDLLLMDAYDILKA